PRPRARVLSARPRSLCCPPASPSDILAPSLHDAIPISVAQLQPGLFLGRDLLALAEADWSQPSTLSTAKRLMRQALAPHLGGRPLVSRELFMDLKEPPRA